MMSLPQADFPRHDWGATAAAWQHLSVNHGLRADLVPVVANPDAPFSKHSTLKSKGKTPSEYNHRREIVGIKGWPSHEATAAHITRWARDPDLGICVITRRMRAIDVDVTDEAQASAVRRVIVEAFLFAEEHDVQEPALRTRGNSARFLMPIWLDGTYPKRIIRTAHGLIEFLGDGQQFVAVSTHQSGQRYEWNGPGGLPAVDAIPRLSPDQFERLWAMLQERFGVAPGTEARRGGAQPKRPRTLADANDPLLGYLEAKGWVVNYQTDGRVDVRCPWGPGHSVDSGSSSTTYFPAGVGGFQQGHWRCLHASCAQRTDGDFFEAVGYNTEGFPLLLTQAEHDEMAAAGALPDGVTVHIVAEPDIDQLAIRERNAFKARAAAAAAQCGGSATEVIDALRKLPREVVLDRWPALTLPLSKDAAAEVVEQVQRLTGVGVRRLNAALSDARTQQTRNAHEAHLATRIGDRKRLTWRPEDKTRLAEQLEASIVARALPGEYLAFGGMLAHVVTKALPGTQRFDDTDGTVPVVSHLEPLDDVAALAMAERAAAFVEMRSDVGQLIGVPQALIDILLRKKGHQAPAVTGLLTHPAVLPDGTIVCEDGLHERSGLFLKGAACPGARPYRKVEAVEALERIRRAVLVGFEFDSTLSADAALAGLFTGIQRRLVDMAPGLAVIAGAQASGKTTLARRLHLLLTGQDMPVATFAAGDEPEMQKRLLSLLLRSPAMVCFDNLADGTTFRSAALAAAMTGPVLSQRVLGVSRDADAPTNVLFVLTGNNLSLGADEATRWLVTRLAPAAARPEERQFEHADVVAHALSIREAVLRDAVGIVAGFLKYGRHEPARTRFAQWDRLVRQPLMWAGTSDLAQCFAANTSLSEDLRAHGGLMQVLCDIFGTNDFSARHVASVAAETWGSLDTDDTESLEAKVMAGRTPDEATALAQDLRSVLESLRARDATSGRSVSRVLQACVDRVAMVETCNGRKPVALASRPNRLSVLVFRVVPKTPAAGFAGFEQPLSTHPQE
jgi:hypothetical protein